MCGHIDVVLHGDGEASFEIVGESNCERQGAQDPAEVWAALQTSKPQTGRMQVYHGIFVANNVPLEAGIGCHL